MGNRKIQTRSRPGTAFSSYSFTRGPAMSLLDSADIADALKSYHARHASRATLTESENEESELSDSDSNHRLVWDDGPPHILATAGLKDEQMQDLMDAHVPRMKIKRRLEGHDSQVLPHHRFLTPPFTTIVSVRDCDADIATRIWSSGARIRNPKCVYGIISAIEIYLCVNDPVPCFVVQTHQYQSSHPFYCCTSTRSCDVGNGICQSWAGLDCNSGMPY